MSTAFAHYLDHMHDRDGNGDTEHHEPLQLAPTERRDIDRRLDDLERRTRYIEERLRIVKREAGEDEA